MLTNHTTNVTKTKNESVLPNGENDACSNSDQEVEEFISATIFTSVGIRQSFPCDTEVVALSNINQGNDNDNNNIISISSTDDLAQSDQKRDGLRYILGYIAKKYHDKFPDLDLGTQTKNIAEDHSYCQPPTFVRHLSVAGLFEPSSSLVNYDHKMEMIFVKMHPDGILQKKIWNCN